MGPKKTFEDIISETTIDDIEEPDATKYINLLKDKIVIDQFPLKIKIIITSEFKTPIAFDRIESHYSNPANDDLIDKFKAWVDQFQERGSGFDFNGIKSVQDKPILNKYEEDEFQEATECYICGKEFEENNKVREHDHLSGKYRGAACQSCNTKEGQAILDYSKQLMYDFYYNVVNKLWKKNELIASDTDSIFLNIKTEDIYEDMKKIEDELDTSGYPKDHPLYSEKNKKVIGKFKDELNGKIMNEIVYLRGKAYSFTFVDLNQIKEEKKIKRNWKNYNNQRY
ncbi:unnamed protein product [Mytilus coruscus]|uniref:DNA-directed DNA polymerase n=1 Tax=Mytilus coruscus TaxID=42192 RepID=A0A6J7ZZI8_MYTCO|nr:unnamed protein product [Mytilus coruscus]